MFSDYPRLILLLSGKRKSGKDYTASKLMEHFGEKKAVIIRLSAPLKSEYARTHGVEFERLLDDSAYKEMYRIDMIQWSEETRQKTPSFFCQRAILESKAWQFPIWIVSDARRQTDLNFFTSRYGHVLKAGRITASEETRKARGWIFTPGVDDVESECGLDHVTQWDFTLNNDGYESAEESRNSFIAGLPHID